MLKFTYISKEFFSIIKNSLIDFKEVKNHLTGGDDDFLLIDVEAKEFSWFEFGTVVPSDLIFNDNPIFGNSDIINLKLVIKKIEEDTNMFFES